LRELKSELSQVTYQYNAAGKVLVNKAPDGHASPDRADSVMIAFAPVKRGI
jgi:phage terminase large subunit